MSDVIRLRLLLFILAVFALGAAACNLSDPVAGLPSSGCEDDGDCSNNGTCDVDDGTGSCSCDPGYTDSDCSECADGYEERPNGSCALAMSMTNNVTNNNSNNSNNNNTTGECEDDEVLFDGQCVTDGCAGSPCGDGTCEITGDNAWLCDCPDGTSGISCPRCEDGCINGACNDAFECVCDQGWAGDACNMCAAGFQGANCDMCAANAFGDDCDTCATINAAEPWWDMNYGARRALIVYNPGTQMLSLLDRIVVQHEFRHDLMVTNGVSDILGGDIRVVNSPDNEIHRVLGFSDDPSSGWNRADTTIWFPTVTSISPGDFDVFYLYSNNAAAPAVLNDASQVLFRERGWYTGSNGPVYSPQPLSGGTYSIQVRQKNPLTMQVYFHDSSNATGSAAEVRFVNTATGAVVDSVTYGASMGSSAMPANLFDEFTGLPNSMRVDITISSGTETGTSYLGPDVVYTGTGTDTYQATLVRASNMSAPPQVFECAPEMRP